MTVFGSKLVFGYDNYTSNSNDNVLYISDGTTAGTTLLTDVGSSISSLVTVFNGKLYLASNGQIYTNDGSGAGSSILYSLPAGYSQQAIRAQATANGLLYFSDGASVFATDGTTAGTTLLSNINPYYEAIAGGKVFFAANNQIWVSNGTATGTIQLTNFTAASNANPDNLTVANGLVYFTAADSVHGYQLWQSDGTAAGTILSNIYPEFSGTDVSSLTAFGGSLYFQASTSTSGFQLWRTDGTATGTVQMTNITPGLFSQTAEDLTAVGNTLYFAADDGIHGLQLYQFQSGAPVPTITSNPTSQTVNIGQDAIFTAGCSDSTATVQWMSSTGGAAFTPISGATGTTLTLHNVTLAQNGTLYEAVFTNAGGSVTSAAVPLVDPQGPITYTATTGGPTTYTLTLNAGGTILELIDSGNNILASQALAHTNSVNLTGHLNGLDILNLNFANGYFSVPGGIFYNGGGTVPGTNGGTLNILAGDFANITDNETAPVPARSSSSR